MRTSIEIGLKLPVATSLDRDLHCDLPMPLKVVKNSANQNALEGHKLHALFSLKYTITRQLGQGGQGIVFECISRIDRRKAAVKFIHKMHISPDSWISLNNKRIPKEVHILSNYIHDGMISILDFFDFQDYVYIVMELFGFCWENNSDTYSTSAIQTQIPRSIKPKAPLDLFE
jgi:serine/threonine protein kinase